MFALMREGGPAMVPLFVLSVCALGVIIDRALYLYHARCRRDEMMETIGRAYHTGGLDEALAAAHTFRGPVARVVRHALMNVGHATPAELESSIERMKLLQQSLLERRLYVLGTTAAVTPFIGLFGTVVGIQRAFHDIAESGQAGIGVVGAGISEALIATAAGLGIAIVAVVAYNVFNSLIDHVVMDMDLAGDEALYLLDARRS